MAYQKTRLHQDFRKRTTHFWVTPKISGVNSVKPRSVWFTVLFGIIKLVLNVLLSVQGEPKRLCLVKKKLQKQGV